MKNKIDIQQFGMNVGIEESSRLKIAKLPVNFHLMRIVESLGSLTSEEYISAWNLVEPDYNKFHSQIGDGYSQAYERHLSGTAFDSFAEVAIRILHFLFIHNIGVDDMFTKIRVTPLLADSKISINELAFNMVQDLAISANDEIEVYKKLLKLLATIHHWFIIHSSRDMVWHINARLYYKKCIREIDKW